jgi:hypothetical protein
VSAVLLVLVLVALLLPANDRSTEATSEAAR